MYFISKHMAGLNAVALLLLSISVDSSFSFEVI
jgi:hypothetical protein